MISSDIFSANGDKFSINIDSSATIYDLKMHLEIKYGIPTKSITFIFHNKILKDSECLKSIEFDRFPGLMIESPDISKAKEIKENDGKNQLSMAPKLSNSIADTVEIAKLNRVPCTHFSLNYTFSRSVPVTFLSLNSALNKNAILNSATVVGDIFNFMNFDHSQCELYSIRRVLYDNEKLSDIGINRQFSFRATQNIKQKTKQLKELKIYLGANNSFNVPVTENMQISELKQYISFSNSKAKKENILLNYAGICLNDQKSLSYYKIPNKGVITYSILDPGIFIVILINGDFINANYTFKNRKCKIREFMSMIEIQSTVPTDKMFLFYDNILIKDTEKTFNDLTKQNQIEIEIRTKNDAFFLINSSENKKIFYKIDVKKEDSIFNIKKKISELFNVLIGDQILFYNDVVLNNSMLIDECNIEFGSVLELNLIPSPSYFPVSIAYKATNFDFEGVHQDLYIRDLKQLIVDKTDDLIDEIELTIQPRKLDDNDMLSDLHINGGLTLFLSPKFTPLNINVITVMNDNFKFLVYPEMTIKIFKQILDYVLGQLNLQILIFFNGKQAYDDATFQYIGVTESSTLYVLFQ